VTGAPVAAIDCGTNSTRVLIARGGPDGALQEVDRRMVITRLGSGVDARRALDGAAVERTLDVLRGYRRAMDDAGVERVRASGTSAVRDAANGDEFLAAAAEVVGAPVELLSGDDEGRMAFGGATADLDPADGPFLVVDIGGGSTEFIVGTTEPEGLVSVDVGCVRLTERFLHSDPPQPEELSAAISVTLAHLDDVARDLPATREARQLVGVAGTVTTVAAVELGLPEYDRERTHHFRLTRAAAEDVFRTLATEARADRIHNPGLEEARADVIVGGCCVLVAVMRFFEADELLVSEADLLDGLARSLLV
jgi:exopolyphosphatase/guanosine-5'-triphosphate,3'-diphosphate pyrophosphatase